MKPLLMLCLMASLLGQANAAELLPLEVEAQACHRITMDPTMKPEASGCLKALLDRELSYCDKILMDPTMRPEARGCRVRVKQQLAPYL